MLLKCLDSSHANTHLSCRNPDVQSWEIVVRRKTGLKMMEQLL